MTGLDVNQLPKELQNKIKKDNGVPTRKVKVTKNEIQDYSFSLLNQLKGLSKSDKVRSINMALRMLEV